MKLKKTIYLRIRALLEYMVKASSLHAHPRFYDPGLFKWVSVLESHWTDIRSELDRVLEKRDYIPNFQDVSEDQRQLTTDNLWKTFFFLAYGIRNDANSELCPKTASLLDSIPEIKTAFFSILMPGKEIPEHRGPYNGVLRYHLALKVPRQPHACGIDVDGEVRTWIEGRSLVFDDSYPHKAWNRSDEIRVVLFVDFVRPTRWPVSYINRAFIAYIANSAFVQRGMEKQRVWNERMKAAMQDIAREKD